MSNKSTKSLRYQLSAQFVKKIMMKSKFLQIRNANINIAKIA